MPVVHACLQIDVYWIWSSSIAKRKKAEAPPQKKKKTLLTEADDMALSQNSGQPIAEAICGGSSSEPRPRTLRGVNKR